jgi:hypothetical protein
MRVVEAHRGQRDLVEAVGAFIRQLAAGVRGASPVAAPAA